MTDQPHRIRALALLGLAVWIAVLARGDSLWTLLVALPLMAWAAWVLT